MTIRINTNEWHRYRASRTAATERQHRGAWILRTSIVYATLRAHPQPWRSLLRVPVRIEELLAGFVKAEWRAAPQWLIFAEVPVRQGVFCIEKVAGEVACTVMLALIEFLTA